MNPVRTTVDFDFISNRWGEPNEALAQNGQLTAEDLAAIERLLPRMAEEITFVAKDAAGQYGLVFEANEFTYDGCEDEDEFVKDSWSGQRIGDKLFDGTTMPTLEEATACMESTYLAPLRERYPDIDWHAAAGPHTAMCRLTLIGFVPETSPRIEEMEEIAQVVVFGDKAPAPTP